MVHRDTGQELKPGDPITPRGTNTPESFQGLYQDKWKVPTLVTRNAEGTDTARQHTDFRDHEIVAPGQQWQHRWYTDFAPGSEDYRLVNNYGGQEIHPGDEFPTTIPGHRVVYRGITRLPGSHSPGYLAADRFQNGKYVDTDKQYTPLTHDMSIVSRTGPSPLYEMGENGIWRRSGDDNPYSALEYLHDLSGERTQTTGDMGLLHDDIIDRFGQWFDSLPPEHRRDYMNHPIIESAWNDWMASQGRGHRLWQGSGVGGNGGGGYGQDDTLLDRYVKKQTRDWDPDKDAFDPREFGL